MKLWSGVVTDRLAESRDFYVRLFQCEVLFDSDWFVLLELGGGELGLLAANLDNQAETFRTATDGRGLWVVVDVHDARAEHERLRALDVPIILDLRDEPWGDRHFTIEDPNGVPVDIVEHRPPQ